MKLSVKFFVNSDYDKLADEINEFICNTTNEVLRIQYEIIPQTEVGPQFSAMVVYE